MRNGYTVGCLFDESRSRLVSSQQSEFRRTSPCQQQQHPADAPIVLFDGVCNLCNGAVIFILRNDPKRRFRFAALQSPPGQALLQTTQPPNGNSEHLRPDRRGNAPSPKSTGRTPSRPSSGLPLAPGIRLLSSFLAPSGTSVTISSARTGTVCSATRSLHAAHPGPESPLPHGRGNGSMKREKRLAVVVLLSVGLVWMWFVTHPGGDPLPQGSVQIAAVSDWKEPSSPSRTGQPPKNLLLDHKRGSPASGAEPGTVRPPSSATISHSSIPLQSGTPWPPGSTPQRHLLYVPDTGTGAGLLYGKNSPAPRPPPVSKCISLMRPAKTIASSRRSGQPIWSGCRTGKHSIISRMEGDYLNSLDGPRPPVNWRPGHSRPGRHSCWESPRNPMRSPPWAATSSSLQHLFKGAIASHYPPTAVLTEFDPAAPARNPKNLESHHAARIPCVANSCSPPPRRNRILWIVEKQASGFDSWFSRFQFGYNPPLLRRSGALYLRVKRHRYERDLLRANAAPTARIERIHHETPWRISTGSRMAKGSASFHKDSLYIAPVD